MSLYLTKDDLKTLDNIQKMRKTFNKTGEYDKDQLNKLFPDLLSSKQALSDQENVDSDDEHTDILRSASVRR